MKPLLQRLLNMTVEQSVLHDMDSEIFDDCIRLGVDNKSIQILREALSELEELELFKSEHLRLEAELNTILHPNGDSPTAPSFCDLVAFVRNDLKPKTCEGCIHYSKHTNFGNWCNCNRNQTGDKYDTMVHER